MIRRLFRLPFRTRGSIAREADAELRFNIDARTEKLIAEGFDASAARAQAEREFGDVDDARQYITAVDREAEAHRRRRDFMGDLVQDVQYAIRKLRGAPTFAIAAILTLAVGIGANTTVFNLVNAVLIKPPTVSDPDRMAWITPTSPTSNSGAWTMPDFVAFRDQSRTWSHLSAFGNVNVTLNGTDPERLAGLVVNGNYFEVTGVRPMLGRAFLAYEDSANVPVLSAVISYAFWRREFNGDSTVIGREIQLNSKPVRIVGVAPIGFNGMRLGDQLDIWIPFPAFTQVGVGRSDLYSAHSSRWLRVIGRLAPGATMESAQAEASVLQVRLEPRITTPADRRTLEVGEVRGGLDPGARTRLTPVFSLMMLVPLLVLGVACANVANLFVSRSVQRQKELALRRALGASNGRLIRQLLTETAILGLVAGAVGVAISYGLTGIISRVGDVPDDVMRFARPDATVFVLTFGLALAAGVIFGLLPALAATRSAITPALKNDGSSAGGGKGRHRLRNAFVVSQVAFSLALLITAGLFVGSLRKALGVEPGYDPRNTIAASYDNGGQGYTPERLRAFDEQLVAAARAQPGAEAVAIAEILPLSGSSSSTSMRREDQSRDVPGTNTLVNRVTPGYFEAMRIPIVQGRAFTESDNAASQQVIVVNERLAEQMWPGQNPIGQRARSPWDSTGVVEVIGVARNGRYRSLAEARQEAAFWASARQFPIGTHGELIIRARGGTTEAVAAARAALKAVDPTLPISKLQTLEAYIAETVTGQRAGAALLAVFGGIALLLAALGIFGVIAQGVAARTREIGIRMSLGARAADVVRGFVREGLVLTSIGAVIGVLLSLAASKVLANLLFGLKATDALTFAGASVAIVLVAAVASFVPARRAAKVDPLVALRSD